jgi:DNA-directed RNA polymerase specialized sigma24 family protein
MTLEGEVLGRKQLVRDVKRAALARMEDVAKTAEDFEKVLRQWDRLDENRERREQNHEIGRPNVEMLHWDKYNENDDKGRMKEGLEVVIPRPLNHAWWRQQLRGDFLDTIFDCPYDLHELVEDADVSDLLRGLSNNRREILYYRAIRQYNTTRIAAMRGQTARNILKAYVLLRKSLQDKLASIVREQLETKSPQMTLAKRRFLARYDKRKAAVDSGKDE